MWCDSLVIFFGGLEFQNDSEPIKGLPNNVEASKNAWGLSIEYVFILIQKIAVDRVADEWFKSFG